jgi:hypothetical protein
VLPRVLQGIVPKTWGWSITLLSWQLVCDSIHRLCVAGNCLGYRPGSLRRIFTGSYSLPPSLVAIRSFTFRACSSPAPTPVKPQPAPAILSQESVHTTLSITDHTRKRPSTSPRTTHGPQYSSCNHFFATRKICRGRGKYLWGQRMWCA